MCSITLAGFPISSEFHATRTPAVKTANSVTAHVFTSSVTVRTLVYIWKERKIRNTEHVVGNMQTTQQQTHWIESFFHWKQCRCLCTQAVRSFLIKIHPFCGHLKKKSHQTDINKWSTQTNTHQHSDSGNKSKLLQTTVFYLTASHRGHTRWVWNSGSTNA